MREHPPFHNLKRDKLIYILHLIYWLHSRKKKNDSVDDGFTHISRFVLGKTIKDYKKYLEYLKENGVIEEGSNYSVGNYSRGIRFVQKFRKPVVPVKITDWTLIKNIVYLRKHYNFSATEELIFLKKWFEHLDIDIKGALNYLFDEYLADVESGKDYPDIILNSRLLPIMQLYRKNNMLFFVDNTSGRLHTNLTQLKSELRKFLKYKGKTLCSIDLSNSQPFLLLSITNEELFLKLGMVEKINSTNQNAKIEEISRLIRRNKNKEDVEIFKNIVSSGKFYEMFAELLIEEGQLDNVPKEQVREKTKDITISSIFSENHRLRYSEAMQIFKKTFPSVYQIIAEIKKKHHPTLAIVLQKLEAELFLHHCCKLIQAERPDVPIFTLHDSIITTEEHVEYVKGIILRILSQNLQTSPNLKIERWE